MTEKTCYVYIGIGDIITTKSYLLDAQSHGINKIKIGPSTFHQNMRSGGYVEFIQEFMKTIFKEPLFELLAPDGQKPIHWLDFERSGFKQHKIDLSNLLPLQIEIPKQPYFCLYTKIREYPKSKFISFKQPIIDSIKKLTEKYTLVLIGEKEIDQNIEYQVLGPEIVYSLYNDVISNIDKSKMIDLTIPASALQPPSIIRLRQDCHIMKNSLFTINLGYGGNLSISGTVCRTINLVYRNNLFGIDVLPIINKMLPNTSTFYDEQEFINCISSL